MLISFFSFFSELSHQQSREIQEHHRRISASHRPHRNLNAAGTIPISSYGDKTSANRRDSNTGSNNHNSRNIGETLHINLPQIETQSIKQAVTDTVSLIATAARHAKESAQRNLVQYHNTDYDECNSSDNGSNTWDDETYTGPYAKLSNDKSKGDLRGGRFRNVHTPYEDFGLRESMSSSFLGQYDHHRRRAVVEDELVYSGYYGDQHSTTAAAAPLLENNYGMDEELGGESIGKINGASLRGSRTSRGDAVNPSNGDDRRFVLLETFRVKKDGWGAVPNLDLFFASLYNYYYHRGIVPIIGKGIVELISLFFTLWLSVFLFQYLDWKGLWECRDEETCRDTLSSYILEKVRER